MAHKNISKKINSQNNFYETIVDIYNEGGCESVREYIDNNDIDSTEYNNALEEMLEDDNTDELFELMITHEKFKHTEIIDEFIRSCNDLWFGQEIWTGIKKNKILPCNNKFKLDLVWKMRELNFCKVEIKLKQYEEEIKSELSESERRKELESKISQVKSDLMGYFLNILISGCKNALINFLDHNPTIFKPVYFSVLFYHNNPITDKTDFLNYILNNENTKKVVTENFIDFVYYFTKKETLSTNMTEETFKKVLDVISKNVSEEQFQFLLEYLIKELVYVYSVMIPLDNILNLEEIPHKHHYNIIELVKYIHNLYGHKFKISFNIDYDYSYHKVINDNYAYDPCIHTKKIYDQMIFNGYEFLSAFASIFYEDLFFPKKDLINHINDKNNLLKRKIKEGDVNRKDMIPYIEYKKTLSEFISNIHTIMKEIDSKQLEYLKTLIDDVNEIHDEMMDKYIHRLI